MSPKSCFVRIWQSLLWLCIVLARVLCVLRTHNALARHPVRIYS
jgi:hypothetical protein